MRQRYKILLGMGVGIAGSYIYADYRKSQMLAVDTVIEPPVSSVSIIVPVLNEEKYLEESLLSIRTQSIIQEYPEMFELIVVDGGSTDNSLTIAEKYADKVISPVVGKLTARNMATDMAKGDIIVAADGDTMYYQHWLNTLLKPFQGPEVVAVSGSIIQENIPFVPITLSILGGIVDKIIHPYRLTGNNCAYLKSAFIESGKFNESTNQLDISAMIQEEETGFGNRMAQLGKVVYQINAPSLHLGGEKIGCRIGTTATEVCDNLGMGTERF